MAKPSKGRDHRKALAGKLLLTGEAKTQRQALIQAGFSPSTASKPTANGLAASHCIEAALVDDPSLSRRKIAQAASRVFQKALARAEQNPEKIPLSHAAKAYELACRVSDGAQSLDAGMDPRQWADRLIWVEQAVAAVREARERASLAQGDDGAAPEAGGPGNDERAWVGVGPAPEPGSY